MKKEDAKNYVRDVVRLLAVVACASGLVSAMAYLYDSQVFTLDRPDMHVRTFGLASIGLVIAGGLSWVMLRFRETSPFDRMVVVGASALSVIVSGLVLQLPMIEAEYRYDMPGATGAQFVVAALLGAAAMAILKDIVMLIVSGQNTPQSHMHRVFFAFLAGAEAALIVLFLPATSGIEDKFAIILFGVAVVVFCVFYVFDLVNTRRPKEWTAAEIKEDSDAP